MSLFVALYLLVGLVAGGVLFAWAAAHEIRRRGWRGAGRELRREWVAVSTGGLRTQWLAFALAVVVSVPLVVALSPERDVAGLVLLAAMWIAAAATLWKLGRR